MKDLEVWFIAVTQMMYGDDAVVAFDAHSAEMVKGVNDSGKLPVKVMNNGSKVCRIRKSRCCTFGMDGDWKTDVLVRTIDKNCIIESLSNE